MVQKLGFNEIHGPFPVDATDWAFPRIRRVLTDDLIQLLEMLVSRRMQLYGPCDGSEEELVRVAIVAVVEKVKCGVGVWCEIEPERRLV